MLALFPFAPLVPERAEKSSLRIRMPLITRSSGMSPWVPELLRITCTTQGTRSTPTEGSYSSLGLLLEQEQSAGDRSRVPASGAGASAGRKAQRWSFRPRDSRSSK